MTKFRNKVYMWNYKFSFRKDGAKWFSDDIYRVVEFFEIDLKRELFSYDKNSASSDNVFINANIIWKFIKWPIS